MFKSICFLSLFVMITLAVPSYAATSSCVTRYKTTNHAKLSFHSYTTHIGYYPIRTDLEGEGEGKGCGWGKERRALKRAAYNASFNLATKWLRYMRAYGIQNIVGAELCRTDDVRYLGITTTTRTGLNNPSTIDYSQFDHTGEPSC